MQVAIDDSVPFPVVVDGLHCQGDENQSPDSEAKIGQTNVGGANADDAEKNETERIGQFIHRNNKSR